MLYWSARAEALTRAAIVELSAHPIYKQVTVRNLNTTKKIATLLDVYP